MTHAIAIDRLAYRAGRHFAIRDLTMRVPNGSVYGFLGPNGSGKTTTIRLLLGMLPPADGAITVLGHEIPRGAHHALARIGYVPERLHLYPMLTVEETMRYHAALMGRKPSRCGGPSTCGSSSESVDSPRARPASS
jgi:ABC-2 type transport system ATP-binding protein